MFFKEKTSTFRTCTPGNVTICITPQYFVQLEQLKFSNVSNDHDFTISVTNSSGGFSHSLRLVSRIIRTFYICDTRMCAPFSPAFVRVRESSDEMCRERYRTKCRPLKFNGVPLRGSAFINFPVSLLEFPPRGESYTDAKLPREETMQGVKWIFREILRTTDCVTLISQRAFRIIFDSFYFVITMGGCRSWLRSRAR